MNRRGRRGTRRRDCQSRNGRGNARGLFEEMSGSQAFAAPPSASSASSAVDEISNQDRRSPKGNSMERRGRREPQRNSHTPPSQGITLHSARCSSWCASSPTSGFPSAYSASSAVDEIPNGLGSFPSSFSAPSALSAVRKPFGLSLRSPSAYSASSAVDQVSNQDRRSPNGNSMKRKGRREPQREHHRSWGEG